MFNDEKITIQKVKDIIYAVRNEFENEIDTYETSDGKELTDNDIFIMFEFLDKYIDKLELVIDDELEN